MIKLLILFKKEKIFQDLIYSSKREFILIVSTENGVCMHEHLPIDFLFRIFSFLIKRNQD